MNGEDIINKILLELNIKAPTFAENIGVLYQRIFDIQKGKTKKISSQLANAIISVYPQFNLTWLLTGQGEMLSCDQDTESISNEVQEPTSHYSRKELNEGNGFTTYLLPMSAMGGTLTGFAENGVTLQNCEAVISPIENVDFAITVYGESMAPEYPSGSRILIKKINPSIFIEWGKAYVLDTPNGVIVKEVRKCEGKPEFITCHSINPDPKFSDFDVEMSEIYGMYRVLMCLSAK